MADSRPRGWWYPWIFVAAMALVVVVNGVLVAYAVGTFPGLATDDHYRKGLAYNDNLAGARAQDALGWRMDLAFVPGASSGRSGDLAVRFTDTAGHPIEDMEVQALLVRPTHDGFDVRVTLAHRGAGTYGAAVAPPLAGQWEVRVRAFRGDQAYQGAERIQVP